MTDPSRSWAVGLGVFGLAAWSAPQAPRLITTLPSAPFPVAILAIAHLALLSVAAWLALVLLLDRLGGLPRRLAHRVTPRWAHGLLLASVSTLATVVPAQADPGTLDGLRLPDRPAISSERVPAPQPLPPPQTDLVGSDAARSVEVRRGDTLWAIVAAHLGPEADVSAVAAAVDRWYHLNHAVIGADADLLRPGQVLEVPKGSTP